MGFEVSELLVVDAFELLEQAVVVLQVPQRQERFRAPGR